MRLPDKKFRQRGIAVLMTAGSLLVTVPMVGLAIDVGLLYAIKARLATGVDAGALAGARSLSRGLDLASQRASATATAQAYFTANFPNGYLLTSSSVVNVTVDETVLKVRSVNVQASVSAPLYFMRVLGLTSNTVAASGTAARRDVNVMMVMDRSYSLTLSSSCGAVKAAAAAFVNNFAEGRDRLGLLTFGGSVQDRKPQRARAD